MKKMILFFITCAILVGCGNKDKKNEEVEPREGYVIDGKVGNLNAPSMAFLTYETKDETFRDSAEISKGSFQFKGKVSEPRYAMIEVRHGKSFVGKDWQNDGFSFLLENASLKITAKDSIIYSSLTGSPLQDQDQMLRAKIKPYKDKAMENYMKYKKSPTSPEAIAASDSAMVLKNDMEKSIREFIDVNKDSYMALKYYDELNLFFNYDPIEEEKNFNTFSEELKSSEFGQGIFNKIQLAKKSEEGAVVADFNIPKINGESFTFSSLKGQYVLVEFWASWCAPCRAENPNLKKIYAKHHAKNNFEIVGISLDDDRRPWEGAVKIDNVPWIQVSEVNGFKDKVAVAYDIKAIPQNFLVGPDGIIVAKNLRGEELATFVDNIYKPNN